MKSPKFTFLQKTSVWNALSKLGQKVFTPQGIFYWSSRAKAEATIDGTIGVAQDDDGTISHLHMAEEWAGPKAMERAPKGKIFGYAPIPGLESLRKKWLAFDVRHTPELQNFASLPVVTNGITHSLALAGRMVLGKGDVLITADKSWENYEHIYTDVQGIKIETFPLFDSNNRFNPDGLVATCREVSAKGKKKIVILLNFPHNQTGFMPTQAEAKKLGDALHTLCREMPQMPFVILLDDAYEGYVYDPQALNRSILPELFAPLANLTIIKLDGISKVMLAYGYRVGFVTVFANPTAGGSFAAEDLVGMRAELTSKIGGLIRAEISQAGHHGQVLADALLDNPAQVEAECGQTIAMLKERWEVMMKEIEAGYTQHGRSKIVADPCNGGFFCFFNTLDGVKAKKIAEKLLKQKKIGIVPSESGMRVAFAGVSKEKIPEMIRGIFEVVYK